VNFSLYGCVTIFAAVLAFVFAPCAYAFVKRLEARANHPLGEEVGAHKAVLRKLRKRESMSQREVFLNRPGKCGGSRPWKRGWSHAERTGAWKADVASV
jgi:hypothetical protein